jgi:hypothetical protein
MDAHYIMLTHDYLSRTTKINPAVFFSSEQQPLSLSFYPLQSHKNMLEYGLFYGIQLRSLSRAFLDLKLPLHEKATQNLRGMVDFIAFLSALAENGNTYGSTRTVNYRRNLSAALFFKAAPCSCFSYACVKFYLIQNMPLKSLKAEYLFK